MKQVIAIRQDYISVVTEEYIEIESICYLHDEKMSS